MEKINETLEKLIEILDGIRSELKTMNESKSSAKSGSIFDLLSGMPKFTKDNDDDDEDDEEDDEEEEEEEEAEEEEEDREKKEDVKE